MQLDQILNDILDAGVRIVQALAPPALGSAVAVAWQRGLPWGERLMQWLIGMAISYYVTRGLTEAFSLSAYVGQSVGFIVGTLAYQSFPGFVEGCKKAIAALPDDARDGWKALFARIGGRADRASQKEGGDHDL